MKTIREYMDIITEVEQDWEAELRSKCETEGIPSYLSTSISYSGEAVWGNPSSSNKSDFFRVEFGDSDGQVCSSLNGENLIGFSNKIQPRGYSSLEELVAIVRELKSGKIPYERCGLADFEINPDLVTINSADGNQSLPTAGSKYNQVSVPTKWNLKPQLSSVVEISFMGENGAWFGDI